MQKLPGTVIENIIAAILPLGKRKTETFLNMKLLLSVPWLICKCANIAYLYLTEGNCVLIHEEIIPQSSRKSICLLRPPFQDSHPTFTERPYEFKNPFKGFLHIHYPSKGYPTQSVTSSLI